VRKFSNSRERPSDIGVSIPKVPRVAEVANRLSFSGCQRNVSQYVRRSYVIRTASRHAPRICSDHWLAQGDDVNQIDDKLPVSRQRLAIRQLIDFICYDKFRVTTFIHTSIGAEESCLRAILCGRLKPTHPRHALELSRPGRAAFDCKLISKKKVALGLFVCGHLRKACTLFCPVITLWCARDGCFGASQGSYWDAEACRSRNMCWPDLLFRGHSASGCYQYALPKFLPRWFLL
jgi:hypothetical protein